jgi:hypothetical protein
VPDFYLTKEERLRRRRRKNRRWKIKEKYGEDIEDEQEENKRE